MIKHFLTATFFLSLVFGISNTYAQCKITFTQTFPICPGQSVTENGHTYKATGTYRDVLKTNGGCDSIVTTILTAANGVRPVTFTGPNNITLGDQPYVLTTADFNGDGFPDLAIPNNLSNSVSILLGDGKGGFTIGTPLTTSVPWSVTNADFNNDGKIDLAVTNMSSNTVSIFMGDGLGGFAPASTPSYPAGSGYLVRVVTTADFNNDGKADLAVSNQGSNNVTILLGNGDGTFTAASGSPFPSGGNETMGINSGDFNGDGKLDLAVGNLGSADVSIFLGNGDGTFTSATVPTVAVGNSPYGIFIADFNNDGNLDLAAGNNGSSSVSLLLGDGSGGFGAKTDYKVASGPQFGILTDFNGDGINDIAIACQYSDTASILLGDGSGGFSQPINFKVGNNSAALTSADFNGDGVADLAVTNFSQTSVSILLSPTIPVTVSDDTTVCAGAPVQLNVTGGTGFKWTSSTATIACDTCHNPIVNPAVNSKFFVTVSQGICSSSVDSVTVTVTQGLTLHTVPADTSICSGSAVAFSSTGANTYTWSPFASLTCVSCANTVAAPTISTTYIITGLNGNCSANDTVSVLVGNLAIGGKVNAVRDTICAGTPGSLTLSDNSANGIQWQSSLNDSSFSLIGNAGDTSKYKTDPLTLSTYYRAIVGTGTCTALSDTLKLVVPPSLTASFTFTVSNNTVTLNSHGSIGNISSYYWDFGDNATSNDSNPVHNYSTDTIFNVCLTIYDGSNCSYTFCRDVDLRSNGIAPVLSQSNPNIYPNPFTNDLNIENISNNKPQALELYDLLGQIVINKNLSGFNNPSYHLNSLMLAKGMYFLVIKTGDGNYIQRVVKE